MTRSHVPRTASVFGLITWDNDGHFQVFNPPVNKNDVKPQPGDIVVYEFSHTGIVSRKGDATHNFFAIEGHTNDGGGRDGYEVAERRRNYSSVRKFVPFSKRQIKRGVPSSATWVEHHAPPSAAILSEERQPTAM